MTELNQAMDPRRDTYSQLQLYSPTVDYDSYSCYGCYGCETGDDCCRGAEYENIRISEIDPYEVLDEIFGPNSVPSPEPLIEKFQLDDLETYVVVTTRGYYGDEYECYFANGSTLYDLTKEWYGWSNANDVDGVYKYLSSKGQRILGLSPLDNLKEALALENQKELPSVKSATKLDVKRILLNKVNIPNMKHFEEVEPLEYPRGGFAGVIANDKLVDGYHRLKWLMEDPRRKYAKFIILGK